MILDVMRQPDGRLWHSYKDGQGKVNGLLEDYACLIDGLTRLYEATGEVRWIDAALTLTDIMNDQFRDPEQGGYFDTGRDHEPLIVRPKSLLDNATPSSNAVAATALLRLGALTGRDDLTEAGRAALRPAISVMRQFPTAAGQSLIALDFQLASPREFAVIAGPDPEEFRGVMETLYQPFLPNAVTAPSPDGAAPATVSNLVPLLADRPTRENRTTTYICENFACREPVIGIEGVEFGLRGRPEDAG